MLRQANLVASWAEYWEGSAALWEVLARASQRVGKAAAAAAQGRGFSQVDEAVRDARLGYMRAFREIKTALGAG